MTSFLRVLYALAVLLPISLCAQVPAGDPTGLQHSTVGMLLAPPLGPFPSIDEESGYIDLQGDGTDDLILTAVNMHVFDADGSHNSYGILQSGVAVAVDMPNGYNARRFDLDEPIDASVNWREYGDVGINSGSLAALLTNFVGQWARASGSSRPPRPPRATSAFVSLMDRTPCTAGST